MSHCLLMHIHICASYASAPFYTITHGNLVKICLIDIADLHCNTCHNLWAPTCIAKNMIVVKRSKEYDYNTVEYIQIALWKVVNVKKCFIRRIKMIAT